MAIRTAPWAIDGNSHPAQDTRIAVGAILGSAFAQSWTGGVGAVDPGHGVATATALKVTQNTSPNMGVKVAEGAAFIRGTESSIQGCYSAVNDASTSVTIAASDPTNPRRDLVILQVRDASYSGASRDARLFVVQGTPAASPADPSLTVYPNALVLARVAVAAGATTITNANITDLRTAAGEWFRPRGRVAGASVNSTSAAVGGTTNFLSASAFNSEANRRYRISITFYSVVIVGAGVSEVQIRISGAGSAVQAAYVGATAGTYPGRTVSAEHVPGAVSGLIYALYAFTNATSVQFEASASAPYRIWVEDIGGALA